MEYDMRFPNILSSIGTKVNTINNQGIGGNLKIITFTQATYGRYERGSKTRPFHNGKPSAAP